jgi:predicted Fe-Mo cluster-binding NifX family protein
MRFTSIGMESDSMQRIAVPLMRKRVAPYFGHCDELLLIERGEREVRRTWQALQADDPWFISRTLAGMNVQKVVCGGIWVFHKNWLAAHGIEVIENQSGSVEEVVRWVLR